MSFSEVLMKQAMLRVLLSVMTVGMLSACAEKGPVLLDGIKYQAPEALVAGVPKIVVGVAPFKDDRGKTASVLGKRTIRIGGEIKMLWVEVVSQPLNVKIAAEVQLRVSTADVAEKKIFRTLVLNSKMERQDVAFSFESVSGALSEALSSALDQLMKDEEFKKKIH